MNELDQSAWQPIETAPYDVPILVYWGGDCTVAERRKDQPYGEFLGLISGLGAWEGGPETGGQVYVDHPTRWMPLPEPPLDGAGE